MTDPFAVSPAMERLVAWLSGPECGKYLKSKTAEQLTEIIESENGTSLTIAKESWHQLLRTLREPLGKGFRFAGAAPSRNSYPGIIDALSASWEGEAAEEAIGAINSHYIWLRNTYNAIQFLIERIEKTLAALKEAREQILPLEKIQKNRINAAKIRNSLLQAFRLEALEEKYKDYYNTNLQVVQNYFHKIEQEALQLSQNPFTPPPISFPPPAPHTKSARNAVAVDPGQV